jgi:hypothetical protein
MYGTLHTAPGPTGTQAQRTMDSSQATIDTEPGTALPTTRQRYGRVVKYATRMHGIHAPMNWEIVDADTDNVPYDESVKDTPRRLPYRRDRATMMYDKTVGKPNKNPVQNDSKHSQRYSRFAWSRANSWKESGRDERRGEGWGCHAGW